ncbi:MAG: hypothetical protein ACYDBQ_07480 [Thermoplasmatota archaeon]
MIDEAELTRLRTILAHEALQKVPTKEKRELREIIGRYSDRAWDLPWYGLVDVARYAVALNRPPTPEGAAA